MGLILNRGLLNKDFVLLVVELNKDVIESVEEVRPDEVRCCLKPISNYLPPFFLHFRFQIDSGLRLTNVPDPEFKGYVQLHLNDTFFTFHPVSEEKVEIEAAGPLSFSNSFPTVVEKMLQAMQEKMFTRLKIFVATL
jgi:hypothetical protein